MAKEKDDIEYVDDGRTLADMSGVPEGASRYFRNDTPSVGTFREKLSTFWAVFKMMLAPTLVVGLMIAALYWVIYILFRLM
ncbi:MAG: hypothetical protein E7527_04995 [Ruminococcaceae bacterium]|nr:hypothetical protein [Oscillospiraceae bacterium]